MKLLVISLALIGSIFAMPVDDVSTQTSSDQPLALPALDAKSAVQPAEKSVGQLDTTVNHQGQDNSESDTTLQDTKTVEKPETPIKPEILKTPESDDVSSDVSSSQDENKGLNAQNQEIKRETNTESQSKSDQPENKPEGVSSENDLHKVPLSVNIGEAVSKLASVAEDAAIPPALESVSNPNVEKKVDIAPSKPNTETQSETDIKSESITQEKREIESTSTTEKINDNKDEHPNTQRPMKRVVIAREPDENPDDYQMNKFLDDPSEIAGAVSPVSPKSEDVESKSPVSDNPTVSSAIEPAAKSVSTKGSPMGQAAGFIDDTVRKVRDTVDEIKDGKTTTTLETSSPATAKDSSTKVDEPAKTDNALKKQDSAESNESKDDESSVSRRANNSSQEDSSEEKDEKKQNSSNSASPVTPEVTSSTVPEKSGQPVATP